MSPTPTASPLRELARRENHGLRVTLMWNAQDGNVFVVVDDVLTNQRFEIDAPAEAALHVFHHPFAYMASGTPGQHTASTPAGAAAA